MEVIIDLDGKVIKSNWVSHFSQPGLHRYMFKVSGVLLR